MINQNYLGEEKVSKLLLKFSVPCILSLLIGALYNIADQIFIGNSSIGFLGNTATTVVYPITVITLAFALFFGDGTAAFLSLCQGKKDTAKIHKSVGNMLICSLIVSALIMLIVGFGMDSILYKFGATDNSFSLAKDYCKIVLIGVPFYMISTALGSIIRADGNPKFAMISMLLGAIINIVLDPILIFVFNLGIKGAAFATITGQIISFIFSISYLFKAKTFKLSLQSFVLDFKLIIIFCKLGISSFLTQISIVIMSVVSNYVLKKYGLLSEYGGDIPVAVYGIVMKIYQIVISIVIGVAAGGQPIIGYNFGAAKFARVKKTYKYIIITSLIVSTIFFVLFESVPAFVIGLFGSESELYVKFGNMTLRIYLLLIIFTCTMKVSAIFLQALGNPLKSMLLSLVRDIVILVPLTLILPISMGIEGVLWAAPISDIFGIILTIVLVATEMKKINRIEMKNVLNNEF